MSLKVYGTRTSGNCNKVFLLAALLGIEFQLDSISTHDGANHTDAYLHLNPRGQVPTLQVGADTDEDKLVLNDSAAILVYLAGTKPEKHFWSQNLREQAVITQWLAFAAGWVTQGLQQTRYLTLYAPRTAFNQEALAKAHELAHKSLVLLNSHLSANDWLALGRPTIADVACVVYVALGPVVGISLGDFENVQAWIERIRALPRPNGESIVVNDIAL